jgi:hypothetical protein
MGMKRLGKVLPALLSVLFLVACGGSESDSSGTVGNAPTVVDDKSNSAPVISGTAVTSVDEGVAYSFRPEASDEDGDTLTFSIDNLPNWASFDTTTGLLSGTPDFDSAGTYSGVVIRVTDGELSAALRSFDIVVNDVNRSEPSEMAPVLVSAEIDGSDILLTWTQDGLTPDGGYDVFIDGVDTGSQYRTTLLSATISGLDLESSHCFNVESRYTTSNAFYTSNQICSEAQTDRNEAPTISGTPANSVKVGEEYAFTPTASDADNDELSFTISNLPSWASFDDQTGAITGSPEESDVGDYEEILVSVTDGTDTVSLSAFSIEVVSGQAATGSLTLNWKAPSSRTDGTPLDPGEIDGYFIYMGETVDSMKVEMELTDGTADNLTLSNIPVGNYVVALSVYDMNGVESNYSNTLEVSVSN